MIRVVKTAASLARHQGGAAAVEFAIVSSVFFAFIMAIAYLGLMLFTDLSVHWALESGARLAAINTSTTQSAVASAINGYLGGFGIPSAQVTYTPGKSGISRAYINATLTQTYTVPLISTFTITYSATTYVPQSS